MISKNAYSSLSLSLSFFLSPSFSLWLCTVIKSTNARTAQVTLYFFLLSQFVISFSFKDPLSFSISLSYWNPARNFASVLPYIYCNILLSFFPISLYAYNQFFQVHNKHVYFLARAKVLYTAIYYRDTKTQETTEKTHITIAIYTRDTNTRSISVSVLVTTFAGRGKKGVHWKLRYQSFFFFTSPELRLRFRIWITELLL